MRARMAAVLSELAKEMQMSLLLLLNEEAVHITGTPALPRLPDRFAGRVECRDRRPDRVVNILPGTSKPVDIPKVLASKPAACPEDREPLEEIGSKHRDLCDRVRLGMPYCVAICCHSPS